MMYKKPVRGVFLDIGFTLLHPVTEYWFFPLKAYELCDMQVLDRIPAERKNAALTLCMDYLDKNHLVLTEEDEYSQFCAYYALLSQQLPELGLDEEKIRLIARDKVYNLDNLQLYDDASDTVRLLSETYRLGIISDTWPSMERLLKEAGLYRYFSAVTFSCFLGIYKPHPGMYRHALAAMGLSADETVFVDDSADNLKGAADLGIRGVQIMTRPDEEPRGGLPEIHKLSELPELLNRTKQV